MTELLILECLKYLDLLKLSPRSHPILVANVPGGFYGESFNHIQTNSLSCEEDGDREMMACLTAGWWGESRRNDWTFDWSNLWIFLRNWSVALPNLQERKKKHYIPKELFAGHFPVWLSCWSRLFVGKLILKILQSKLSGVISGIKKKKSAKIQTCFCESHLSY